MNRTKYLELDEVQRLCEYTKLRAAFNKTNQLSWIVVDFALSTGLRVSEMANTNISDIDFGRDLIWVWRLKKKKPCRDTIPLSPELKRHIKKHLNGRKTGRLFVGQRGDLSAQGLQRIWKRAVKLAQLPQSSIHTARHTFATHHWRKNKDLVQLQTLLGHSSPTTTANMYVEISHEDKINGLTNLYRK